MLVQCTAPAGLCVTPFSAAAAAAAAAAAVVSPAILPDASPAGAANQPPLQSPA